MKIPDKAVKDAYDMLFPYLAGKDWGNVKQRIIAALETFIPHVRRKIADLEITHEQADKHIKEGGSSEWNAGYDAAIIDVMNLLGEEK